ncbi:hypothetical protein [Streptomyces sp. NPDC007883]|uniref:hypothetical protein n=1 Tax=Streptomyces sp. NPDC007883 TaxID=3155116 RepID=UPI0034065E33
MVLRGRLRITEYGGAVLDVGGTPILFDVTGPPLPEGADGAWVETRVAQDRVAVWPYEV